ncbi:MAG: response regulator [Myxococcota bacterium]
MTTKTILVVDDSSTVRRILRRFLTKAGFKVLEAEDGQDGFELTTSIQGIDAILCDVHMPIHDGFDMLKQVRSTPSVAHLPFVLLTSAGDPDQVNRARSLGAHGWIVKPVKEELLIQAMQTVLSIKPTPSHTSTSPTP